MLAHDHLLPAGGTRGIVMHRVCMYELAREERATVSVCGWTWWEVRCAIVSVLIVRATKWTAAAKGAAKGVLRGCPGRTGGVWMWMWVWVWVAVVVVVVGGEPECERSEARRADTTHHRA